MCTWGNQCTILVCVAHSIPRGNIFLLFYYYYLNVNKLRISFQSFAVVVVYPYDNSSIAYSSMITSISAYYSTPSTVCCA